MISNDLQGRRRGKVFHRDILQLRAASPNWPEQPISASRAMHKFVSLKF